MHHTDSQKYSLLCKHFLSSGCKTTLPDKLLLGVILLSLKIGNLHFHSHLATDSTRSNQVAWALQQSILIFKDLLEPSTFSCLNVCFHMLRYFKVYVKDHLKMGVLKHLTKSLLKHSFHYPSPQFLFLPRMVVVQNCISTSKEFCDFTASAEKDALAHSVCWWPFIPAGSYS